MTIKHFNIFQDTGTQVLAAVTGNFNLASIILCVKIDNVNVLGTLVAASDGMSFGWTSPMVPFLLSNGTHIETTEKQVSKFNFFI